MRELIKTWRSKPFSLRLYNTGRTDSYGKCVLAYTFRCNGKVIFDGEDFCCSPMHAIDSRETIAALLSFLALRPGDTDREYFDRYTEEQMAFAIKHGEYLSILASEMEERANRKARR